MKRRDLIQLIGAAARTRGLEWVLRRQGAEHEIWAIDGREIAIPRHREIHEITARSILRSLEAELGKRWW